MKTDYTGEDPGYGDGGRSYMQKCRLVGEARSNLFVFLGYVAAQIGDGRKVTSSRTADDCLWEREGRQLWHTNKAGGYGIRTGQAARFYRRPA